jgi:hypothetical protein
MPKICVADEYVDGWSEAPSVSDQWDVAHVKKVYDAAETVKFLVGGMGAIELLQDLRLFISQWEPKTSAEWTLYLRAFDDLLLHPEERGAAGAIARMYQVIRMRGRPLDVRIRKVKLAKAA